jgi:hypothetical protein
MIKAVCLLHVGYGIVHVKLQKIQTVLQRSLQTQTVEVRQARRTIFG